MERAYQQWVPAVAKPTLYSEITMLIALGVGITIVEILAMLSLWQSILLQNGVITFLGTFLTIASMMLLGLYGPRLLAAQLEQNLRLVIALVTAFLLTAVIMLHADLSFVTACGLFAFYGCAGLALFLSRKKLGQSKVASSLVKRVLILGAGQKALQLMEETDNACNQAEIIGFIHQPGERERLPTEKVIYCRESLASYATKVKADEIVVAVDDRRNQFPMQQLLACRLAGIDIIDSTYFSERELRKMKINAMELGWLIFSNGFGPKPIQRLTKRLFDLTLASVASFLLMPIWFLVILMMVLRRGFTKPLLARQSMVGFDGHLYQAFSFATSEKNDLVDKCLNRCHLRHLPLLFNILGGSLSFVGPQAYAANLLPDLEKSVHFIQKRQLVKPGIFGWAQLQCDLKLSADNIATILEYDLYYLKNMSLLFDCVILVSGISKLRRKDALTVKEQALCPSL
jgi:lipopolysaccharide/colanic/teichoic acid biosynthesis glycosyltransferase